METFNDGHIDINFKINLSDDSRETILDLTTQLADLIHSISIFYGEKGVKKSNEGNVSESLDNAVACFLWETLTKTLATYGLLMTYETPEALFKLNSILEKLRVEEYEES